VRTYSATFLVDKDGVLKLLDSLIRHAVEANQNSIADICPDAMHKRRVLGKKINDTGQNALISRVKTDSVINLNGGHSLSEYHKRPVRLKTQSC
jgi:hypothetical protein